MSDNQPSSSNQTDTNKDITASQKAKIASESNSSSKRKVNPTLIVGAVIVALFLIASAIFSIFVLQERLTRNQSTARNLAPSIRTSSAVSSLAISSQIGQTGQSSQSSTITNQIYTNQFFPDLKIVYGSDWVFKTTTRPNEFYNGQLVERTVSLQKGSSTVTVSLQPVVPTGCSGDAALSVIYNKNLNNGLFVKAYTENGKTLFDVSRDNNLTLCPLSNRLITNISLDSIPQYKDSISLEGSTVQYIFIVRLSDNIKVNSPELKEVEAILAASTFK